MWKLSRQRGKSVSDRPNRKPAGQPSVSTHPAFPVIVALWFAALLGIGSMVLPMAMFDNFAVASGLSDVSQPAQPPLGATARILVALVAAAIGAIAGLLIARRVAAANAPAPATRRAAAMRPASEPASGGIKRPISAHEELGEGGLDADDEEATPRELFAGRRRALSVTDESARSEFLSFAPLPGQNPNSDDEPLDLLLFEEPEPAVPAQDTEAAEPVPAIEPEAVATNSAFGTAAMSRPPSRSNYSEVAVSTSREAAPFTRKVEPETAAPIGERSLGELGVVELVERFAIALQRHREASAAMPAAEASCDEPIASEPDVETAEEAEFEVAADRLVQAEPHAPHFAEIPAALRPFGFDEDVADDADGSEDLPDFDLTAALSQSRSGLAAPAAEPEEELEVEAATDDESEVAEAEYTSLLAMKSPFGLSREPVRIDDFAEDEGDEPVVVFPGQAARRASPAADGPARDAVASLATPGSGSRPFDAPLARVEQAAATARVSFGQPAGHKPANPGDTERALRDALEKLQKMSGAA